MRIIVLTSALGGALAVHQVNHQVGLDRVTTPRVFNLLVLDARRMTPECFSAACAEVGAIRKHHRLNHGVLFCETPTLPLTVAAIRCGLRDVIHRPLGAMQLRALIQAANPGVHLSVAEFDAIAAMVRMSSGLGVAHSGPGADLSRRETELAREKSEVAQRVSQLSILEARLVSEREALAARERDLRERTRRMDRQLAMLQNDADVGSAPPTQYSSPPVPSPEMEALVRKLEKRSAELDLREKLLTEMQALLTAAHGQSSKPSR